MYGLVHTMRGEADKDMGNSVWLGAREIGRRKMPSPLLPYTRGRWVNALAWGPT